MHGGSIVANELVRQGARFVFTLCGGHISPILVGAKEAGLRVVDVRNEATAVFAADAVYRLTGVPGVAAVTAGPGVTNTLTALENARHAQSALVLLGGATATALRNRGALQDIDQLARVRPIVKYAVSVRHVRDLEDVVAHAFAVAKSGVPGPVFVELPVDLLYDEETVRKMVGAKSAGALKGPLDAALQLYLKVNLTRTFEGRALLKPRSPKVEPDAIEAGDVEKVASLLRVAKKPVLLVGSQAVQGGMDRAMRVREAVTRLGVPTFVSGMARGLLGREHALLFRHERSKALREADFVLLAGAPCDFRLSYGLAISGKANVVAVNLDPKDVKKNRRPTVGVVGDPMELLAKLAHHPSGLDRGAWLTTLRARDDARTAAIAEQGRDDGEQVDVIRLCEAMDASAGDRAILVGDGGDFVATASYVMRPRGPLAWLDPGVFGTLGVGAGFAIAAKLCHPESEVWLLWGDGAAGYGLSEIDTFVRHRLPVIAVIGNDASWGQIARDQVPLLGSDIGTGLLRSDYHVVADGLLGKGLVVRNNGETARALSEARAVAADGRPVLVNAHLARSAFREGSISM